MNFLLLGLGSIGKRHAAILRGMGHDVMTVDPDPKAGAHISSIWLLKDPRAPIGHDFDGVLDCTPPDIRDSWNTTARARFIEKPLGVEYPEWGQRFPAMMGFCYHWDESLREFVQIVKGVRIHALRIEGGQYLQDWHAEDYHSVKHRYRGVVTDSLPHSIYVARWILGELRLEGYAGANTGHFEIGKQDHVAALLISKTGATVQLYADYLMRPRRFSIDAYAIGRHYHWEFAAKDIDVMYQRQMEAFVSLCAGNRTDGYPNLEDGIAVQRILDAIA